MCARHGEPHAFSGSPRQIPVCCNWSSIGWLLKESCCNQCIRLGLTARPSRVPWICALVCALRWSCLPGCWPRLCKMTHEETQIRVCQCEGCNADVLWCSPIFTALKFPFASALSFVRVACVTHSMCCAVVQYMITVLLVVCPLFCCFDFSAGIHGSVDLQTVPLAQINHAHWLVPVQCYRFQTSVLLVVASFMVQSVTLIILAVVSAQQRF